MDTSKERRVLFVLMPWATPIHPSLALGLLSATLDRAGILAECLYGNLLLPLSDEGGVYSFKDPGHYEDRSAGLAFVPLLYPEVGAAHVADAVAKRYLKVISRDGQLAIDPASDGTANDQLYGALIKQILADLNAAGICLERCLDKIAAGNYDIIGFSLTFETQMVASLALAQRIKQRWPHVRILFGGAACTSAQGVALMRAYDFVDAVCLGEGDEVIVPLTRALRGEGVLTDVPGIAYREGGEVHITGKPVPVRNLDLLPVPDYDPFFQQKRQSEWADVMSILLFETSRGCWWGEKHLCTFCGLNAETLTYRSKSAERVLSEVATFCERWDVNPGLQAVDNILDMRYFKELVPKLIEFQRVRRKRVQFFFEIKSNLKLTQLWQLFAAGITALQPGIESFSDHILHLMDKGASAMQQVAFLKWGNQLGIGCTYNILMRNPGETAEDYRRMTAMLPFITHIQPPHGIANMQLERYSPYFLRPEEYGMTNVRPQPHYQDMFPDPSVDTEQLVYCFDYDHEELDAPELIAARREFTLAIFDWQATWKNHQLDYFEWEGGLLILDKRGGGNKRHRLEGFQCDVFRFIDCARPFKAIERAFPDIASAALRALLEKMVSLRYVYHHADDSYIAVPLRGYTKEEFEVEMEKAVRALASPPARIPKLRELVVLPSFA